MNELDTIKAFLNTQLEKYSNVELGFKYEYDSLTATHLIEVSNGEFLQNEDFSNDSFTFSMDFISTFNEFVLFLKPTDPVYLSRVDYSVNNFNKTGDYINSGFIKGAQLNSIINERTISDRFFEKKTGFVSVTTIAPTVTSMYYSPAA